MELPRAAASSPEVSSKVNYALEMYLKYLLPLLPLHKHSCNVPAAMEGDFLAAQLFQRPAGTTPVTPVSAAGALSPLPSKSLDHLVRLKQKNLKSGSLKDKTHKYDI